MKEKEKMKVAILTYHTSLNMGAVLQCYALQETIEKVLKCRCEVLDYHSEYFDDIYNIKRLTDQRNLKDLIKWFLTHKHKKVSFEKFKHFREQFLHLSDNVYTKTTIKSSNKLYNVFVTGSDQVWNSNLNNDDTTYFLDFVNDKNVKTSYAASFGSKDCTEFVAKNLKEFLKKYKAVSVREKEGIAIIKKYIPKMKVTQVLDPTLLPSVDLWESMINERIVKDAYILVYKIADTPNMLDFARDLSKKTGMKIICIHNSYNHYKGMNNITDASPLEFLNYLKYAEYVISSSFHGVCFSLNLQKEFFYELDSRKINNNSRIISLIDIVGLKSREIKSKSYHKVEKIDYLDVNKKLALAKSDSIKYIKKIGEVYNEERR